MKRILRYGWIGVCFLLPSAPAYAVSFGDLDARALSLGGTSVAVPNLATGHLYNPALLALHRGDEDTTDDGRHTFPQLSARYSDAAEVAWKAVRDDLEGRLSRAIAQYNAAPGAASAEQGERTARDLEQAMIGVQSGPVIADLYLGYTVTEPGHKEGGAFFVGSRIVGSGTAVVEPDDLELVGDYVEALQYLASDGAAGQAHPELFTEGGQLADPDEEILSRARGRVGVITEIGVSAAKLVKLGGQVFSFGFSPKAVNLQLFDDEWLVEDGDFESTTGNEQEFWRFNADLGMIWAPSENLLLGLTSKDIVPMKRRSEFGYEFELNPRTRAGVSYRWRQWLLGADLDLYANRAFVSDERQQYMSIGISYSPSPLIELRGGYSYDLHGTFGDRLSAGVGVNWSVFSVDLAFADTGEDTQFALQFGVAH